MNLFLFRWRLMNGALFWLATAFLCVLPVAAIILVVWAFLHFAPFVVVSFAVLLVLLLYLTGWRLER
jgi:hypothetical protein